MKPLFSSADGAGGGAISADQPLPPDDRSGPGRPVSLDKLYRAQAPKLLRMFARRTGSHDAHDLVHDSFVRLARMTEETRSEIQHPEAHLRAVGENELRNRARAAYHRSIVVQDPNMADTGILDITAHLEARDLLKRLDAAMLKLDPKTREIFMALRLDGLTYAEVAKRAGLSVKGVEWRMRKALAALHRAAGHR